MYYNYYRTTIIYWRIIIVSSSGILLLLCYLLLVFYNVTFFWSIHMLSGRRRRVAPWRPICEPLNSNGSEAPSSGSQPREIAEKALFSLWNWRLDHENYNYVGCSLSYTLSLLRIDEVISHIARKVINRTSDSHLEFWYFLEWKVKESKKNGWNAT